MISDRASDISGSGDKLCRRLGISGTVCRLDLRDPYGSIHLFLLNAIPLFNKRLSALHATKIFGRLGAGKSYFASILPRENYESLYLDS